VQYQAFIGLSIGVMVLVGIGYFSNNLLFQRFLGGINPLAVGFFIVVLGFVLLSFILSKDWFSIYKKGSLKGLLYASGLAAIFGSIAILVDFTARVYPADINIQFPESLVYYPAIGFFVEILFQVLPLTVILVILTSLSKKISFNKIMWASIFVASLPEPVFQVTSLFSGQSLLWFAVFELARIFLVILSQLTFFRRYDFVTMYWFRIVYYIFWHILWGNLRLVLLF
jgi:hypothetical protein